MTSLFIACVVVVGYAFVYVPNVELVTATVFLSGILLGPKRGLVVGVLGEFLYSVLNPIGMAAPPLLVAQVVAMGTVGLVGGLFSAEELDPGPVWRRSLRFALVGLGLTFLFDLLTTSSFLVISGFSIGKLWAAMVYGAPFYAVHLLGNAVIFAVVLPACLRVLRRVSLPADLRPQETGYRSA
jgi:uncharacterized membrane protein